MTDLTGGTIVLNPAMTNRHTDTEEAGLHDGALGQTWREYLKVLEHQAEQRRIDDVCATSKRMESQQAEFAIASENESIVRGEFNRVEEHYRLVADDKDRKPAAYNGLWGVVFIILAVLLVCADFPLTRQIVSAMSIGSDVNWTIEQVLVSIGIVAMSLFFKLLIDPFTAPQYLMGKVRRIVTQLISGTLFVCLLGGVITMLILLGMFRAGTVGANTDTGPSAVTTATEPPGAPAPSGIDVQLRALEKFRDQTFVVMSLILPVIGGIFASVGMARIHNAFRYRHLHGERHRLRIILDQSTEKTQMAAALLRSSGHDLSAIRDRVTLANGEYHSYLHTYQTGLCRPEIDRGTPGMASRLREMVEKWAAIVDQTQNFVRTDQVSTDAGAKNDVATVTILEGSPGKATSGAGADSGV